MAMRQKVSEPQSSSAPFTWSASPVDTPPDVTMRSWSRAAALSAVASDARSSRNIPRSATSHPSLCSMAISMKRLGIVDLRRLLLFAGRYEFIACREHRYTQAACDIEHRIAELLPRARHAVGQPCARPYRNLRPGQCLLPPGERWRRSFFKPAGSSTKPSPTTTSSCMKTVSKPFGICAPVKMRTAATASEVTDACVTGLDAARYRQARDGARGESRMLDA